LKVAGILNKVFRPQKTLKKTRIKLYNTLALPVLLIIIIIIIIIYYAFIISIQGLGAHWI
jgi:hypothetical protein